MIIFTFIIRFSKERKGKKSNRVNSNQLGRKGSKKKNAERDEELYLTRWLEGRMREGK